MLNQDSTARILHGLLGLVEIGHTSGGAEDQKSTHTELITNLASQNKDLYVGLGLYQNDAGTRYYPTLSGDQFIEPTSKTKSKTYAIEFQNQREYTLPSPAPDAITSLEIGSGSNWTVISSGYFTYVKPKITLEASYTEVTPTVGNYIRYTYSVSEYTRINLFKRQSQGLPNNDINTSTQKLDTSRTDKVVNSTKISFPIANSNWGRIGYVGLFYTTDSTEKPFLTAPIIYYNGSTKQNYVDVDGSSTPTVPLFPVSKFTVTINRNPAAHIQYFTSGTRPSHPNNYTTYIWADADGNYTESIYDNGWTDIGEIEVGFKTE